MGAIPPKVVFVTQELTRSGGVARVVSYWVNFLASKGFGVTLALSESISFFYPVSSDVKFYHFRYHYGKSVSGFFFNIIYLYRLIKIITTTQRPDFFLFDRSAYIEPLLVLRLFFPRSVRFVYFVHGGTSQFRIEYTRSLGGYLRLLFIRLVFDRFVCLYFDEPPLLQDSTRLSIINNPLTQPCGSRLRGKFKRQVALYVGRIEREKGVAELLEVWAALPNRTGWSLWIVGDGSEQEKLKRRVSEFGLEDVIFYNSTPRTSFFYSVASLYISAAKFEGWGLSLIEAMSRGCPIVTYKSAGARYLLAHGSDGYLADMGDSKQLANYIQCLMDSPELRQEMGKSAYQKSRNFRVKIVYSGWLKLLSQLNIPAFNLEK